MFPALLTEAQARQTVNLPPAGTEADQYTERVLLFIDALTELASTRYASTDADGADRWPTTEDLPARVTRFAQVAFRDNWSADVGALSPSFGPDRDTDPPVGPAWVISYRAEQWVADLTLGTFA